MRERDSKLKMRKLHEKLKLFSFFKEGFF